MRLSIDLPDEALDRARAAADRRGSTVDAVIADLIARLPARSSSGTRGRRLAFIAAGASDPRGTSHEVG